MKKDNNDIRYEVYRKLIHLSSLWMVCAIYFLDKKTSLSIFAFLALSIFTIELLRKHLSSIKSIYNFLFSKILRTHEDKGKLSGAFFVSLAAFIVTLVFSKIIAASSLAVMLISDSFAALIGKKFGSHKILNKSIEGSLSFFISAIFVISIFYDFKVYFIGIILTALFATTTELFATKLRIDDNLTISLSTAISLMILI
jgi:dolichol kinase